MGTPETIIYRLVTNNQNLGVFGKFAILAKKWAWPPHRGHKVWGSKTTAKNVFLGWVMWINDHLKNVFSKNNLGTRPLNSYTLNIKAGIFYRM